MAEDVGHGLGKFYFHGFKAESHAAQAQALFKAQVGLANNPVVELYVRAAPKSRIPCKPIRNRMKRKKRQNIHVAQKEGH